MNSETEEGYVHRPDDVEATDADHAEATDTDDVTEEDGADAGTAPLPGSDPTGFGDRGWVLVGVVVLSVLVVPGIIYLRPALPGEAGLSFVVAMLVLPLVPAVLLGLTAVWSMRASRRR